MFWVNLVGNLGRSGSLELHLRRQLCSPNIQDWNMLWLQWAILRWKSFFVETKCHFQKEIPPRFMFVPIGLSTKVPVVYNHDQKLDLRRFGGWVLVNDPDEQFVTRPKTATGHFALLSLAFRLHWGSPSLRLAISQIFVKEKSSKMQCTYLSFCFIVGVVDPGKAGDGGRGRGGCWSR